MPTSFLFILIAFLLTIGHSLVPHQHQKNGELAFRNVQQQTISDWLERLYAIDLGGNHLNHYQKAQAHHTQEITKSIPSPFLYTPKILCRTTQNMVLCTFECISIQKFAIFDTDFISFFPFSFSLLRSPPQYYY